MAIDKFGKGGFDSADSSFQGLGSLQSSTQFTIFGCMDNSTFVADSSTHTTYNQSWLSSTSETYNSVINYNAGANTDTTPTSCIPTILGCMDPGAINYNNIDPSDPSLPVTLGGGTGVYDPTVDANTDTIPTSCMILGCTDCGFFTHTNGVDYPVATNCNPLANQNDGSCIATVPGCTNNTPDPNTFSYPNYTVDPTGSTFYTVNSGNNVPTNLDYTLHYNFNGFANVDDGSCEERIYGCMQVGAINHSLVANTEPPGICSFPIVGCTNPAACNYNSLATQDDGTCGYCNDNTADNYNSICGAGYSTALCTYCEYVSINATTALDITSNSINISWVASTGLQAAEPNGFDIRYKEHPSGSWVYPLTTPLTSTTTNYQLNNLLPDQKYKIQVKTVCDNTTSALWSGASVIETTNEVQGCTDPNAYNYDIAATLFAPGSCQYQGCTDTTAFNYDPFVDPSGANVYPTIPCCTLCNGSDNNDCCVAIVNGCTDPNATNYDPLANVDDGSCIGPVYGCLDSQADNTDTTGTVNTHDNSCVYSGCTDPAANNYNFSGINGDMTVPVVAYYDPAFLTSVYGYGPTPGFDYSPFYVSATAVAAGHTSVGSASDDGSCTYTIEGCMDSAANNYNPTANSGNQALLCCFGDTDGGSDGYLTNDGTFTGTQGNYCHIGCTTANYTNSSMTNHQLMSPNVPVFTDNHPSIRNAADPNGCLNFDIAPTFTSNIYNNAHPNHTANLITQNFGSSYTVTVAVAGSGLTTVTSNQNMHGIDYSLSCDDGVGGYDSSSTGCPNMDFYNDYLYEYSSKLIATIDNKTIGKRVYDSNNISMKVRANLSGGTYTSTHPYVPFWGDNAERSVAENPSSYTTGNAQLDLSAGAAPTWVDPDVDARTLPGDWFASRGDLLWNYVKSYGSGNTDRTSLINNAKNNVYNYAVAGGGILQNEAFKHTLRITYATGHGAIIAQNEFVVRVGCMDPYALNYCPQCNAMQPFNKYNPSDPVSNSNWTICDYGAANMANGF